LAPDSDDSDDAQAAKIDDDAGSPPDPALDAAASGQGDLSGSGAGGGHPATEGDSGTIAVGGDADTEGTIADIWHPVTDSPTTESPVAETPATETPADATPADEARPGADAGAGDVAGGADDLTVAEPAGDEATQPAAISGEVARAEGDDVVSEGRDPGPVGFDGQPLPGDSYAPTGDETDGSVQVPPPPAAEEATAPRSRTKAVVVLTVLSLVVVGAGVGGLIWSRSRSAKTTPPPPAQAASPLPTISDGAFVTFNDPESGMSIKYPRGWKRSEAPVREIRLLVSDGKQFSALVRVTHTDVATTPANLANLKAVTDGIVGPGAQILKEDPITVNDLIGYRYIYTLTDKDSGLTTAHLHYFLFQGHKMNSVVFEALPSETFPRIEGVFNQMLASFHSDPEPP